MAARRPLVQVAGRLAELPVGDTLAPGAIALEVIDAAPASNQNDYSPTGWTTNDTLHRVLDLTPTASVIITGLADGADGDLVTIRNSSTNRLVILPDQSTSSSAANRFDFRNPVFLVPGASVGLIYDGTSARWEAINSSGGIGFGAFFDFFEDFTGSLGACGTAVSGTGASAQIGTYLQNSTERPIGIWQIDTGTTATGKAQIGAAQASAIGAGYGAAIYLTRIAVEALSSGTERFQIFAGFHDAQAGTNVTDGVYWVYRDDVSGAWQGATAAAASRTETGAAGPTVGTNYIWLGIYVDPTWARATFFYSEDSVNWTIAGELTATMPSGTQYMGIGNTINKTVGTTQRNLANDLIAWRYDALRG